MRKTIAAASIAIGGFGVLGLSAAAIAGAQDDPSNDERGGWVQDALSGLVENGTITEEQADAVEEALEDARPDRGFEGGIGHPGFAFGFGGISTVAESLGIGEDELRAALADGQTIAAIAEEQGVDVQDVVDDIVAAQRERLDEAVAEGHLTQEEADEFLAGAEKRVTAFVNGEPPDREDLRELPHFGDRGLDRGDRGPWADGPPWDDDSSENGAA
jgi:polyhydroxyalkanoate synthesis regulator phasin